jgi:ribosomal protein L37E
MEKQTLPFQILSNSASCQDGHNFSISCIMECGKSSNCVHDEATSERRYLSEHLPQCALETLGENSRLRSIIVQLELALEESRQEIRRLSMASTTPGNSISLTSMSMTVDLRSREELHQTGAPPLLEATSFPNPPLVKGPSSTSPFSSPLKEQSCKRCGRYSHHIDNCYAKTHLDSSPLKELLSLSPPPCKRCGRNSHHVDNCYAKTHLNKSRLVPTSTSSALSL